MQPPKGESGTGSKPLAMLRLMRPRQWLKNGFVLAPLFFSKQLFDVEMIGRSLLAFAAFSLIASFLYILNDWRDVDADRSHPRKRGRPLAAGEVTSSEAAMVAAASFVGGGLIVLALWPAPGLLATLAVYVAVTLGYTAGLKHVALLELFLLASGYVLRVVGGALAIDVPPSPWILVASGLLALLITAGKRRADIAEELRPAPIGTPERGYSPVQLAVETEPCP